MLELYGMVVDADTDLQQDRPAPPGATADVAIRHGPRIAHQQELPAGTEILRCDGATRTIYAFSRGPAGDFTLRFFGACDFRVGADLQQMEVRVVHGVDGGLASVLTSGASLAFQLYQRGNLVLHASAVEVDGAAWGFVGRSGMGKSTMAALLCSSGAALITDDVLRVDDPGGRPVARLGATELRLRKGADTIAGRFSDGAPRQRRSADDREVLRLRDGARDRLPLDVLVVPFPSHDAGEVEVRRLTRSDALLALAGFPRLLGWRDPVVARRQFEMTAALVDRVPVLAVRVPWGPPFAETLVDELRARVADQLLTVPAR